MTSKNEYRFYRKVKQLRWKYRDDKVHDDMLSRIVGHAPVTYLDYMEHATTFARNDDTKKARLKRARRYIRDMVSEYDELHFITLTFSDEVLAQYSETALRRFAREFLAQNTRDYFANADFGTKHGRLHFHALVAFAKTHSDWPYGFFDDKIFRRSEKDIQKVSRYIDKVAAHSVKETAKRPFHKRGLKEVDNLPF